MKSEKTGNSSKSIGVSVAALTSRVRRALRKEGEVLRTDRRDWRRHDWMGQYIVDVQTNAIIATCVDIVGLAESLGVLKPYEYCDACDVVAEDLVA